MRAPSSRALRARRPSSGNAATAYTKACARSSGSVRGRPPGLPDRPLGKGRAHLALLLRPGYAHADPRPGGATMKPLALATLLALSLLSAPLAAEAQPRLQLYGFVQWISGTKLIMMANPGWSVAVDLTWSGRSSRRRAEGLFKEYRGAARRRRRGLGPREGGDHDEDRRAAPGRCRAVGKPSHTAGTCSARSLLIRATGQASRPTGHALRRPNLAGSTAGSLLPRSDALCRVSHSSPDTSASSRAPPKP
jgi:hypothetical protein